MKALSLHHAVEQRIERDDGFRRLKCRNCTVTGGSPDNPRVDCKLGKWPRKRDGSYRLLADLLESSGIGQRVVQICRECEDFDGD